MIASCLQHTRGPMLKQDLNKQGYKTFFMLNITEHEIRHAKNVEILSIIDL